MDHSQWDRPENLWAMDDTVALYEWWGSNYISGGPKAFKKLLGPQTTTVVFRHRCWVWETKTWALYVDLRGPALHVKAGSTAEEARKAVVQFQALLKEKREHLQDLG